MNKLICDEKSTLTLTFGSTGGIPNKYTVQDAPASWAEVDGLRDCRICKKQLTFAFDEKRRWQPATVRCDCPGSRRTLTPNVSTEGSDPE